MGRIQRIAEQLERLPFELIEPVLAGLRLKDIIELMQYAGPRLISAIHGSPTWQDLWPRNSNDVEQLKAFYFDIVKPQAYIFQHVRSPRRRFMSRNETPLPLEFTPDELRKIPKKECISRIITSVTELTSWLIRSSKRIRLLGEFYERENGPGPEAWERAYRRRRWHLFSFPSAAVPSVRINELKVFFECYNAAQSALNIARHNEILTLANLFEANPTRLKAPQAPQSRRPNKQHELQHLKGCARKVRNCVELGNVSRKSWSSRHMFRWPHAGLVPYDWCLKLWLEVVELCPSLLDEYPNEKVLASQIKRVSEPARSPPDDVRRAIQIGKLGLLRCYRECPEKTCKTRGPSNAADPLARFRQCNHYDNHTAGSSKRVLYSKFTCSFVLDPTYHSDGGPRDAREVEWLAAFIKAVAWMQETFPRVSAKVLDENAKAVKQIEEQEQERRKVRAIGRVQIRKDRKMAKRERSWRFLK